MPTPRLPIQGFPHLFLAAQEDETLRAATLAILKKAGFGVSAGQLVPPQHADAPFVIRTITCAFQDAKAR